jgi:hypothetical protein
LRKALRRRAIDRLENCSRHRKNLKSQPDGRVETLFVVMAAALAGSGKYARLEDEPCEDKSDRLVSSYDDPLAEASHLVHRGDDAGSWEAENNPGGDDEAHEVCNEEDHVTFRIECTYGDEIDVCAPLFFVLVAPP